VFAWADTSQDWNPAMGKTKKKGKKNVQKTNGRRHKGRGRFLTKRGEKSAQMSLGKKLKRAIKRGEERGNQGKKRKNGTAGNQKGNKIGPPERKKGGGGKTFTVARMVQRKKIGPQAETTVNEGKEPRGHSLGRMEREGKIWLTLQEEETGEKKKRFSTTTQENQEDMH